MVHQFLEFTSKVSKSKDHPIPCLDSEVRMGPPENQKPWFHVEDEDSEAAPGGQQNPEREDTVMYGF